jgi:hypothetical protein
LKSHLDVDQLMPGAEYTAAIGSLPARDSWFCFTFQSNIDAIQRIVRGWLAREDVRFGSSASVAPPYRHFRSTP